MIWRYVIEKRLSDSFGFVVFFRLESRARSAVYVNFKQRCKHVRHEMNKRGKMKLPSPNDSKMEPRGFKMINDK